MSCIISRAFILFTDAKDERFTCNFLLYCCQKSTNKEKKNYVFFELEWLIYVEKLSPFSLFALCVSDNSVHILLRLGTFHAHYTNHKN